MHRVLPLLFSLCLAAPLAAQEVDAELLLLVDVSRSMSPTELDLQRRGYAEALRSAPVAEVIGRGMIGQIALSYVEWAGTGTYRVVQDWTMIDGPDDLERVAQTLSDWRAGTLSRTSISGALYYGADSLDGNTFQGLRRIIDISGDGPNNQGRPAPEARDAVLARGVTINGLPLMTREGLGGSRLADLDVYYERCVIGGPGAFVIAVRDWKDFAAAVTRKLVLELAGGPFNPIPAPSPAPLPAPLPERIWPTQATPYDCLIGERMWFQRNRNFGVN